jgi:hypothetical protein
MVMLQAAFSAIGVGLSLVGLMALNIPDNTYIKHH